MDALLDLLAFVELSPEQTVREPAGVNASIAAGRRLGMLAQHQRAELADRAAARAEVESDAYLRSWLQQWAHGFEQSSDAADSGGHAYPVPSARI